VVTTVTENLANAMKSHDLKNENYRVLANVVTDDFFNHTKTKGRDGAKTIFLHVSCFEDKSKNISGMLRVIKSLSLQRDDFHFVMVGDGMDFKKMKAYTRKLGISRKVLTFTGLLEGEELVKQMSSADVLVIFSNYENFPVVINEGFSLGIPVLSTRVGGIPEYVKKYNGRLIDPGDEAGLEHEMKNYLDGKLKFNPQSIRTEARSLFTARAIGKELCEIYHNLVK
jgi:glycosyltransferase involved in cell wall biosynthesis